MALFNRELAIPKYGLEHLEALTPDFPTIESTFKLFLHSTALYVDKKGRVSHLREREDLSEILRMRDTWA